MSQPTCCKCRARPCRCKNYCQCGARIRGDQYCCGPCHEVYLATLPPEPDPAAEIARLQAKLDAKDAALAEERGKLKDLLDVLKEANWRADGTGGVWLREDVWLELDQVYSLYPDEATRPYIEEPKPQGPLSTCCGWEIRSGLCSKCKEHV